MDEASAERGGENATPLPVSGESVGNVKKIPILVTLGMALTAPDPSHAGGTAALPVTAVVLPNSNCRFRNPTTATLDFGLLDSGSPVDVGASAALGFRCNGGSPNVTLAISDDGGSYESGPSLPRMRHATDTTQFLPYDLAMNPTSGTVPRNTNQTLTITGTVRGPDYASALSGVYSDSVVITILP